ncbi:TetR/AcrR family transcriptional regulator [Paracidovorax anthurii]|uniref:TetR family transcriptional regulator n=1 Tax=Paracidovorax anthurii TaxID=78229 RepID=A0A328ZK07_9BURK|nr:TetR/AcrR family transcriptional regulator [Paracidovorax anthurii]RAR86219.1 TetR family transcriptional regulator [Paracidovorax anthurii]
MRYDAEHKQRTRERVVRETSEALREHGPDQIGVATLMARAGLTHGGFYAHFASKEALVAEAIASMFEDQRGAFDRAMQDSPPAEGLAAYIDRYLSTRHRDHRGQGCPVAALSGDLARMPASMRESFDAGVGHMIDRIAGILHQLAHEHPREQAASAVAEMVGALTVARAISDPKLSRSLLHASKDGLKKRLGLA